MTTRCKMDPRKQNKTCRRGQKKPEENGGRGEYHNGMRLIFGGITDSRDERLDAASGKPPLSVCVESRRRELAGGGSWRRGPGESNRLAPLQL